jgi:hypothetical protein
MRKLHLEQTLLWLCIVASHVEQRLALRADIVLLLRCRHSWCLASCA